MLLFKCLLKPYSLPVPSLFDEIHMKKLLLLVAAVFAFGLSTVAVDAEAAKRMGSGKSMGTQKQGADKAPATPPAAAATAAPAAGAAAAAGKRSWMGPLAGLAAGLGLAALASHLGFGDELASMVMMGLLAVAVMAAVAFFMRKRAAAQANGGAGGMQPAYAGAGAGGNAPAQFGSLNPSAPVHKFDAPQATPANGPANAPAIGSGIGSGIGAGLAANQSAATNIPADFDTAAFERNAKVNFIRLQAANDAGNLDDIRQFTTPEMFAEISMELSERGPSTQKNDVVSMDAKVMDVEEAADRYVVSVRFTGLMRDGSDAPYERFDEIWHLTKARAGSGGWMLSGIQQME
jgi:predicted lipid-binding transport protein (Tim44 family)